MLHAGLAHDIADRFALGTATSLVGPVAFGRLGEIWQLVTDRGRFAVKQSRFGFDPAEVERDAAYQDRVRAAGVPMPAVVRTRDGQVLGELGRGAVRAYEWVDVEAEDRWLDPASVGRVVAAIHSVHAPADGPVDPWHVEPVGEERWTTLVRRLRDAGADFADRLEELVPDVVAVEAVLAPPLDVQLSHCDLWADNLRCSPAGDLVVLDWENAGPAGPAQELGMVVFEFGCGEPRRIRELYDAYVAAGGPGRLREPADFTMLVAQTGHIAEVGCERWLAGTTAAERADNAAWVAEFLDEPVTVRVVEELLAAVG